MKYALFLGCTIPVRGQNYELSARKVAEALGIEFVDIPEFACCGFPVKSSDIDMALLLAARNLAIAEEAGLDICTLCNACTAILTDAQKELQESKELREKVNSKLKEINREFKNGVKVRHFSRILYEEVGMENIKKKIIKNLNGIKLSTHYGCHYLKPSEIYEGFDESENPRTVDKLIELTGATPIDYEDKLECCGGAILGVDENISLQMAKNKLEHVKEQNVDALISICPFCTIMYDDNQRKMEAKFEKELNIPVLYYPQLLGLAFGFDQKELGFRINKVKATDLLEKINAI